MKRTDLRLVLIGLRGKKSKQIFTRPDSGDRKAKKKGFIKSFWVSTSC